MKPFLRILLPAAVCGLLLGACTQRQTTLKFMSYNIRNGRGIDNVQDLGRVAGSSTARPPTSWPFRNWTA